MRFPGTLPVQLALTFDDGHVVTIALAGGVQPTDAFFGDLAHLVGPENYRLDCKRDIFADPPEPKPWERK